MEKENLTNEQMEQFINDNMDKVPARSLTKFNEMTTEQKYKRMTWYVKNAEELVEKIKEEIERQNKIVEQQKKNITENQDKIDRIEERYIEGKITKEKADELEQRTFENMQYYRKTLDEANDRITQLENELNNAKPNIHSLRDKVLYVIEKVYVKRLSRFVCQIEVINKWTGEQRTYEYNTRAFEILKMKVKMRPWLSDGSR